MDLVIVTAPYPPGSRNLISPSLAVFEIAPANVLQGAVRLHGFRSSPTPDTHVRVAWAWAGVAERIAALVTAKIVHRYFFIVGSWFGFIDFCRTRTSRDRTKPQATNR